MDLGGEIPFFPLDPLMYPPTAECRLLGADEIFLGISVNFRSKQVQFDPLKQHKWPRFNGLRRIGHCVHSPWWFLARILEFCVRARFSCLQGRKSYPAPRNVQYRCIQSPRHLFDRFWCHNLHQTVVLPQFDLKRATPYPCSLISNNRGKPVWRVFRACGAF